MRKIVILAAFAAAVSLSASASAQVIGSNNQNNNNPNTNTTVNTNTPVNTVAPVTTVAPIIAPVSTNAQQQGQLQGQNQGQQQAAVAGVLGSGNSAVTASGNSANFNANTAGSSSRSGASSDNQNSVANTVNVGGDSTVYEQRRIPVSTAYAPALTSGIDTCLGSLSGGAQTGVFGLSFGGTKADRTCEAIKLGREAAAMGMPDVQCQILAQDERFARALASANRSCALPSGPAVSATDGNAEKAKAAVRYVSEPVVQPIPVDPIYHR